MTIITSIFLLLSSLIASPETPPHSNLVGHVKIDNFKNELFVEASISKILLSHILKTQANCAPQEMLERCGNEYFIEHFKLVINGQAVSLTKQNMSLSKDYVLYNYYLGDLGSEVETIKLTSDFLLDDYEHSLLNVAVTINDFNKLYSLSAHRKEIQINFH